MPSRPEGRLYKGRDHATAHVRDLKRHAFRGGKGELDRGAFLTNGLGPQPCGWLARRVGNGDVGGSAAVTEDAVARRDEEGLFSRTGLQQKMVDAVAAPAGYT